MEFPLCEIQEKENKVLNKENIKSDINRTDVATTLNLGHSHVPDSWTRIIESYFLHYRLTCSISASDIIMR